VYEKLSFFDQYLALFQKRYKTPQNAIVIMEDE